MAREGEERRWLAEHGCQSAAKNGMASFDDSLPGSSPQSLKSWFQAVRADTERLCEPLEVEDHVVQPAAFVSPPKWHLAHTTWFFENFLLCEDIERGKSKQAALYSLLFNSYYKSQGQHWKQPDRGRLSRPTVRTILDYRKAVNDAVLQLLSDRQLDDSQRNILTLGLHHEQQHQELLLMDIKYILGTSPECPPYDAVSLPADVANLTPENQWQAFDGGLVELGADDSDGFAFDNELPRHRFWLEPFQLHRRLVCNGEFLQFMEDGGYQRPEFWLSDGWDWIHAEQISAPLYWYSDTSRVVAESDNSQWHEYHLGGLMPLDTSLPVSHISYYEADAFARWAGARLPTEAELEIATPQESRLFHRGAFWQPGERVCPSPERAFDQLNNGLLWQWTRSPYAPYPGYTRNAGALGEYNGKFMSNQLVLRGGCIATPRDHWRSTYRNFYRPTDRWCFSGIRLARDCT